MGGADGGAKKHHTKPASGPVDGADGGSKKQHRKRAAGPKADKKKKTKGGIDPTQTAKQRNPKAFATQAVNKLRKEVARSSDKAENRLHPLDVDQSSATPPPIYVAVVGPPKVGKSTLITSLVHNFAKKRKINNIKGPVTLVAGKKQRITLCECNNDISCMIDMSKVCDLVLLLIDANSFEMEVMEFLDMCRTHGMPKVIAVITHLDIIKSAKVQQRRKRELKHRIWTELYQGAKVFNLSGVMNGEYQKTDVRNLARFISVQKYRPIDFRATHPYVICDRIEDVTDPEILRQNPKTDRTVCVYGYVRGCNFMPKSDVHVPGYGDQSVVITPLADPCPLTKKEKKRTLDEKDLLIYAPFSGVNGVMCDKDAFYIDIGGSHALAPATETGPEKPFNPLVESMLGTQTTVDDKLAGSGLRLFADMEPLSSKDLLRSSNVSDDDVSDDEDSENEGSDDDEDESMDESEEEEEEKEDDTTPPAKKRKLIVKKSKKVDDSEASEESDQEEDDEGSESESDGSESDGSDDEKNMDVENNDDVVSSDDDDADDDNNEGAQKWKSNLAQRAAEAFQRRKEQTVNWHVLAYSDGDVTNKKSDEENRKKLNQQKLHHVINEDDDVMVGGMFRAMKESNSSVVGSGGQTNDEEESNSRNVFFMRLDNENVIAAIKDCLVTGTWNKDEDAKTRLEEDDALYGGFEDLETGVVVNGKKGNDGQSDDSDDGFEDESGDDDEEGEDEEAKAIAAEKAAVALENETPAEKRTRMMEEKRKKKKALTKAMFDSQYDAKDGTKTHYEKQRDEIKLQSEINRTEFEGLSEEARIDCEGLRPGQYVRVQISNVTCELIENFDPTYPLIVGGLKSGEQTLGFVNIRLKQHRWHKKQLKSTDPVIVSLGWRRFQTIAIFSRRDDNGKHRYLKYTPQHIHCYMTMWGPMTEKGKGMLTIRTLGRDHPGFRISSTGTVLGDDKVPSVEKKLKLMGTPFKVFSKTAFIKDMFTSSREVSKFIGGRIQTVSKIRGEIKKSLQEGGAGSFRATFEDKILLSDLVMFNTWTKIPIPEFYNLVTTLLLPPNEKNKFVEMKTVGQLRRERDLHRIVNTDHLYKPFIRTEKAEKPFMIPRELQKQLPFKDKPKVLSTKKDEVQSRRIAIIREPKEAKVANVMKMITMLYEQKRKQDRVAMRQRAAGHQKQQSKIDANKAVQAKVRAKHAYYKLGQVEKKKLAGRH